MVCGDVVGGRHAFRVDMHHRDHGKAVRMMEGVFHIMGCLVPFRHREVRIHRDRGGDVKLMAVPAELDVGDVQDTGHSCDGGLC